MPPKGTEPALYEIRIRTGADIEETLALQEPVSRLLCPDPHHAPPCDVAWSLTLDDEQADGSDDTSAVLVVAVYASHEQATQVTERVRALANERWPVSLREGDAERFGELVEQYRIESGLHRT